jgi:putative flippase GtrA
MVLRHLAVEEKSPTKLLTFLLKKAVSHKEIKHAVKFGMVGLMGTMIDFTVLNLLIFGAGWNSPLGQLYASIISTGIAVVNSFTWNRLWTFRARNGHGGWQFLQYVVVSIAGLLFNSGIFYLASQFVYGPLLPETWAIQLAKVTAVGIVMFWNFGMNRMWTFRGV